MISFHPPSPSDRSWAESSLERAGRRGCEYSLSSAAMWAEVYRLTVAQVEGFFVVRSLYRGHPAYLFPAGGEDLSAAVGRLWENSRREGAPLRFYSLTAQDREALEALHPGRFTFREEPNVREYLYESESLRTLAGKKLHAKRNHVNRFHAAFPDAVFEPVGPANLEECREMNEAWLRSLGDERGGSVESEARAVRVALEHFFDFGLSGGLLRAGGRVVAYAVGERLGGGTGDTFDVRIEKAFYDVPGAYAAINQEFARAFCADTPYINREDDAGDEGLRKAKLSYRPALLLEKYSAAERV